MKLNQRGYQGKKKETSEKRSCEIVNVDQWAEKKLDAIESKEREESRWDNLIHIDLQFYINDYLFKEEFLWDRRNKSTGMIKQFSIELLREKLVEDGTCSLKEGVGSFTIEFFELAAEFMTRRILEEVKFYDKVNPWKMFKNGIFGSGAGLGSEHLINIFLDLTSEGVTYKDSFEWDLINETNNPEQFAIVIASDLDLPAEFKNLISLSIRRQIKEYVFAVLQRITQVFIFAKEEYEKTKKQESVKISSKSEPLGNVKAVANIQTIINPSLSTRRSSVLNGTKFPLPTTETPQNTSNSNINKTIFTTYSGNSKPSNLNPSSLNKTINTSSGVVVNSTNINQRKDEFEELNKLDDVLSKPVLHLFDYKLESYLGKKTHRSGNSNHIHIHNHPNVNSVNSNSHKPEFLKNVILPASNKNITNVPDALGDYSNPNVTIIVNGPPTNDLNNSNLVISIDAPLNKPSSSTILRIPLNLKSDELGKNTDFVAKSKIPSKTDKNKNTNRSLLNKKRKKVKSKKPSDILSKPKIGDDKQIFDDLESTFPINPHIISSENSLIKVSKEILSYSEYYDKIIIEKKEIAEYLQDLEMFKSIKQESIIKKENENEERVPKIEIEIRKDEVNEGDIQIENGHIEEGSTNGKMTVETQNQDITVE